ncbi:MAG: hypothetical protein J6Q69_01090 [Clostridia bacterium]|nr:hypothetical protein [Clostridia bacterium]
MNKKIFGIRVGTLIQFLLCLFLAIAIWLSVQYASVESDNTNNNSAEDAGAGAVVDCVDAIEV